MRNARETVEYFWKTFSHRLLPVSFKGLDRTKTLHHGFTVFQLRHLKEDHAEYRFTNSVLYSQTAKTGKFWFSSIDFAEDVDGHVVHVRDGDYKNFAIQNNQMTTAYFLQSLEKSGPFVEVQHQDWTMGRTNQLLVSGNEDVGEIANNLPKLPLFNNKSHLEDHPIFTLPYHFENWLSQYFKLSWPHPQSQQLTAGIWINEPTAEMAFLFKPEEHMDYIFAEWAAAQPGFMEGLFHAFGKMTWHAADMLQECIGAIDPKFFACTYLVHIAYHPYKEEDQQRNWGDPEIPALHFKMLAINGDVQEPVFKMSIKKPIPSSLTVTRRRRQTYRYRCLMIYGMLRYQYVNLKYFKNVQTIHDTELTEYDSLANTYLDGLSQAWAPEPHTQNIPLCMTDNPLYTQLSDKIKSVAIERQKLTLPDWDTLEVILDKEKWQKQKRKPEAEQDDTDKEDTPSPSLLSPTNYSPPPKKRKRMMQTTDEEDDVFAFHFDNLPTKEFVEEAAKVASQSPATLSPPAHEWDNVNESETTQPDPLKEQ